MSINEWLHSKEIRGVSTFSTQDVFAAFPNNSANGLKTELKRLVVKRRIQSVYNGFYVIVPVQYQLKGIIPPSYYIDELMAYLKKPYYIGLLSAATLHGAGHQRVMQTQIVTVGSHLKETGKESLLDWNYRKEVPEELILTKNAEVGVLKYSNAELTAVDLIQYSQHIGGYQRAATVLAELIDSLDMYRIGDVIKYTTITTLQRLGYILEYILEAKEEADTLMKVLKENDCNLKSIPMSTSHNKKTDAESNRWRVNMNIDIEIDEL